MPVGAVAHGLEDTIEYLPESGLQYVWTEGQRKTLQTVRIYENKSFNLFGDFLADELWADAEAVFSDTFPIDETPLLESETRETEGTDGVPGYAVGQAYTIGYTQRLNEYVELIPGVSVVRHPANDSGTVYQYKSDAPADEKILRNIDYANDEHWQAIGTGEGFEPKPDENRYDSDFVNYIRIPEGPWTDGGGWLRKKTITVKVTEIKGLKDFYVHTLKADYPIDIVFSQGSAAPVTSIRSAGGIQFRANVDTPSSGSVVLTSSNGSIATNDGVALYGPSPTITAAGSVDLFVEGDQGPLNVAAGGQINVSAISLDNVSSKIVYGDIVSLGGDVFLVARDGIEPDSTSSLIYGNRVELSARGGFIGSAHPDRSRRQ